MYGGCEHYRPEMIQLKIIGFVRLLCLHPVQIFPCSKGLKDGFVTRIRKKKVDLCVIRAPGSSEARTRWN